MESDERVQSEYLEVVPREVTREFPAEFSGIFTEEVRLRFQAKRRADRLSYSELGKLLKVTWLTVRNWERERHANASLQKSSVCRII